MKRILFLTSASVATNPRLLKSAIFLMKKGYECKIISFKFNNWSDHLSKSLINKYNLDCIQINASRNNKLQWLKAVLINKFSGIFSKLIDSIEIESYASDRRSYQLKSFLENYDFKADFIIAHNIAALYPAFFYAKKRNIPFVFDVEDYHPGESIETNNPYEKKRREKLMMSILPHAKKISAASPLIAVEVERFLNLKENEVKIINNTFFESEFTYPKEMERGSKLKLIWFSQVIGAKRGLEEFIEAAKEYKNELNLTLVGDLDFDFNEKFILSNKDFISIFKPMNQIELHEFISNFDVGLALEMSKTDLNRNICLTNKLFAYIQAGLFVLATDTKAQKKFIGEHELFGNIVGQGVGEIRNGIQFILKNKEVIRSYKGERFQKARLFAFENEGKKLLELIQ